VEGHSNYEARPAPKREKTHDSDDEDVKLLIKKLKKQQEEEKKNQQKTSTALGVEAEL
jgi:hypothetical protein